MAKLYTGRSGAVENTTFAVLAPDGETKLSQAGRGPFAAYRNGPSMARGLNSVAKKYKSEPMGSDLNVPFTETVRLGLNIAAADNQPLVIIFAADQTTQAKIAKLVWAKPVIGKFVYSIAREADELSSIEKGKLDPIAPDTVLFVQPDRFGQAGVLLGQIDADASPEKITREFLTAARRFRRSEKSHRTHVKAGIEAGIEWKSKIAVTDAQAEAARRRARGDIEQPKTDRERRGSSGKGRGKRGGRIRGNRD